MPVVNGQAVDEAVTNPAFLDAQVDDTAAGKITLANTDPASGTAVTNSQAEHNSAASFMGKSINSAYNDAPVWVDTNAGIPSDKLFARSEALTKKFNPSAAIGHVHDGNAGQGPQIQAGALAGVRLKGSFIRATDLTAANGLSTNVTGVMGGKTESTGDSVKGVVTNANNRVIIRQATGANVGDEVIDTYGNEVYGRITYSAPNWILSYYVNLSGVETAYSLPSTDIQWFYQELFNPIVDSPVYSEIATVPSENATSDVLDATASTAGKVLLSNSAPPSVGASNAQGSSTRVARQDHAHQGVHSIAKSGSSQLVGDVTLSAGSNVTLTQTLNDIEISSLGGVGMQEIPAGPVNGVNTTFGPLSQTPSSEDSVLVFVDYVVVDKAGWSLVGSSIVFGGAYIPQTGQSVYVYYLTTGIPATPPAPTGTVHVEYHTISAGEATAKQFNLADSPADPTLALVDIIGGTSQQYSLDFTIAGAVFNWSGLGLDGTLAAGDVVRLWYIT